MNSIPILLLMIVALAFALLIIAFSTVGTILGNLKDWILKFAAVVICFYLGDVVLYIITSIFDPKLSFGNAMTNIVKNAFDLLVSLGVIAIAGFFVLLAYYIIVKIIEAIGENIKNFFIRVAKAIKNGYQSFLKFMIYVAELGGIIPGAKLPILIKIIQIVIYLPLYLLFGIMYIIAQIIVWCRDKLVINFLICFVIYNVYKYISTDGQYFTFSWLYFFTDKSMWDNIVAASPSLGGVVPSGSSSGTYFVFYLYSCLFSYAMLPFCVSYILYRISENVDAILEFDVFKDTIKNIYRSLDGRSCYLYSNKKAMLLINYIIVIAFYLIVYVLIKTYILPNFNL